MVPPTVHERKKYTARLSSGRLSNRDAKSLIYFFNEYEADIGVRSTWTTMLLAADGVKPEGYQQPPLERIIGLRSDRRRGRSNISQAVRTREALMSMCESRFGSQYVTALYKFYGPQQRTAPHGIFGEYAQLADMTRAAEELAGAMAAERYKATLDASTPGLKAIGCFEEGYDRTRSGARAGAVVPVREALDFGTSVRRPLSERERFIAKVTTQAKSLLQSACLEYLMALDDAQ